jgi:hypothetical protein
MMAAEEQTTTAPATEWTHCSDADKRRAIDEVIASIAEISPDVVRDQRRAIGGVEPPSTNSEGGLP